MQGQRSIEVSVVVIARNEEAAIQACLESVLEQTEGLTREVIVVDSASTDRTVEVARRYPVTIVRIDSCSAYSPAAGRFVGTQAASGRHILFLDGDMVLIKGWLPGALTEMVSERVAGVAGRLYRVLPGEQLGYKHQGHHRLGTVPYLAGAAMYKREVLQKVGTFNPFMAGEEERELGYRIGLAGFVLRRLDAAMVYHLEKPRTRSETGEKAKYFTGVGQIFRHYGASRISWQLVSGHRNLFAIFLLALLMVALLVDAFTEGLFSLFLYTLGVILLGAGGVILWKGVQKAGLFAKGVLWNGLYIIKGFQRGIRPAADFQATTSMLSASTPAERGSALLN